MNGNRSPMLTEVSDLFSCKLTFIFKLTLGEQLPILSK